MVKQKSSKKPRKSLAGDGRDADVVAKFEIIGGARVSAHGQELHHCHVRGHATILHGNNTVG